MQYSTSPQPRPQSASRRFCTLRILGTTLLIAASAAGVQTAGASRLGPRLNADHSVQAKMAKMPLLFEENVGQLKGEVQFFSRGHGYTLGLNGAETVVSLRTNPKTQSREVGPSRGGRPHQSRLARPLPGDAVLAKARTATLRTRLVGANPGARSVGEGRLPARINYFKGSDRSKWRTNVPAYERVRSQDVYPGIDLVHYGQQGGALEYDFVVAAGANPDDIRFTVEGADKVTLAKNGDLVLAAGEGEVRQHRPICYQEIGGARIPVKGDFVIESGNSSATQVSFALGAYDATRALVIDPVLQYSTLIGGTQGDVALGIATDGAGLAYVTGVTESPDFPTLGEFQTEPGDSLFDAYVSVIDTTQSGSASLLYSSYIGGMGDDEGYDIATNGAGKVYITGHTHSDDFPRLNEFQSDPGDSAIDSFVTVLDTTATGVASLVYSTYLGGNGDDLGHGIAWAGGDLVYVTGGTFSTDFPTLNEFQLEPGDGDADAYVTALDTSQAGAASLLFSTYLGGGLEDQGFGIDADSTGRAYLTGVTVSDDFPTLNEFQLEPGDGMEDAFVTVLDPTVGGAGSLLYSTYLGGTFVDLARNIDADDTGRAFITGFTVSTDFPTFHAFQPEHFDFGDSADAFVVAINTQDAGATSLLFSTYFGGSSEDDGYGIATDGTGRAFVSGFTLSEDLYLRAPYQDFQGVSDAMVAIFDTTCDGDISLLASTYLGGPSADDAYAIATDGNGKMFVAGDTASASFPKKNHYQSFRGFFDAFVSVLDLLLPAPTNLTATANGNSSIDLSWDDTTSNETGFELQRMVESGGWASSLLPADTNAMTDLDVQPSRTYFYRIRAFHDASASPWSTEAFAITGPELPRAPSGLFATANAAGELLLNWTDNSGNEDGFTLQRSTNRTTWTQILDGTSNTILFTDSGLTAGATYYYRVRAYNGSGTSAWSETATGVVLPGLPRAPTSLRIASLKQSQLLLGWRDRSNNESGFKIERKLVGGVFAQVGMASMNANSYTDSDLTAGTQYVYRVRATNAFGDSGYSNEEGGTTLPRPPAAPSDLTATALSSRVVAVAWTDNSINETEFRLERKQGTAPYAQIAVIIANGTSFFDSAVAPGASYTYRIRAANSGGPSAYSKQIIAATPAGTTEGVLQARPTAIRFTGVKPGESATEKLVIANVGKGNLKVVVAHLAPPFTVIGTRTFTLKKKEQRTLKVRYDATAESIAPTTTLGIAGSGRKNPMVYISVTAN